MELQGGSSSAALTSLKHHAGQTKLEDRLEVSLRAMQRHSIHSHISVGSGGDTVAHVPPSTAPDRQPNNQQTVPKVDAFAAVDEAIYKSSVVSNGKAASQNSTSNASPFFSPAHATDMQHAATADAEASGIQSSAVYAASLVSASSAGDSSVPLIASPSAAMAEGLQFPAVCSDVLQDKLDGPPLLINEPIHPAAPLAFVPDHPAADTTCVPQQLSNPRTEPQRHLDSPVPSPSSASASGEHSRASGIDRAGAFDVMPTPLIEIPLAKVDSQDVAELITAATRKQQQKPSAGVDAAAAAAEDAFHADESFRWFFCISPDACTNATWYFLGRYEPASHTYDLDQALGPYRLDLGDVLYAPTMFKDEKVGWMQST